MKCTITLNWSIAIFDNSQFNINKKFQQHATSSNMAEATCRIFLKPTTYAYIDEIPSCWSQTDDIRITYLDQSIPSPYGMPVYKSLLDEWTIADLAKERFSTFENSIDTSGDRIQTYFNVKWTMSVTQHLKRILPYSSHRLFRFSNEVRGLDTIDSSHLQWV